MILIPISVFHASIISQQVHAQWVHDATLYMIHASEGLTLPGSNDAQSPRRRVCALFLIVSTTIGKFQVSRRILSLIIVLGICFA
eukprot:CCRYP_010115-RA/>CCRYP_010115-RA protein AED:0.44 eAED:0.44 QI:4/1/0.5/1/1/0/2/0/84